MIVIAPSIVVAKREASLTIETNLQYSTLKVTIDGKKYGPVDVPTESVELPPGDELDVTPLYDLSGFVPYSRTCAFTYPSNSVCNKLWKRWTECWSRIVGSNKGTGPG